MSDTIKKKSSLSRNFSIIAFGLSAIAIYSFLVQKQNEHIRTVRDETFVQFANSVFAFNNTLLAYTTSAKTDNISKNQYENLHGVIRNQFHQVDTIMKYIPPHITAEYQSDLLKLGGAIALKSDSSLKNPLVFTYSVNKVEDDYKQILRIMVRKM